MKKVVFAIFISLLTISFAQRVEINPQSIVVNPKPSFSVDVWVDKDSSGEAIPQYAIGEEINIGVTVSEDAFVYLFDVRSNGEINQILPNQYDQEGLNNFLAAGQVKYFPPADAPYNFQVDGPVGIDKLIVLASKDALDVSSLANYSTNPNFATSYMNQEDFAQTLSIIVQPKPQKSWVTDTVLFEVKDNSAQADYGTFEFNSNPQGAEVYIFGNYAGTTPLTVNTKVGSYLIDIKLAGYSDISLTAEIAAGQITPVNVQFEASVSYSTLTVGSSPNNAEVYVDGRYVGNSPVSGSIETGEHEIELVLDGYQSFIRTIYVDAGETVVLNPILEALTQTPAPAGDYGTVLDDFTGIRLFPGAVSIYKEDNKHGTYVEFKTDADLVRIMDDISNQLFLDGWHRKYLKPESKRIHAKYVLDKYELYIDVRMIGDNEYSLDIYY